DWAIVFLGFAFCVTVLVVTNQWRDEVLSRYFLALVGPTSIALALGLRELARRWWLRPFSSGAVGMLGVVALSAPLFVIRPAYALPPRYPDASAVTIPSPTDVVFARQIELLGYDLDATRISPGSTIHLTLFYRALVPIRQDYPLTITLGSPLPGQSKAIELLRTYPGRGMDQTSRWVPGQVIADRYTLDIPPAVIDSHTWRLLVGFGGLPPGSGEGGATATPTPLRLLAVDGVPPATVPPEVALASPVTFGEQIQLIGAATTVAGGRVQVRLWWKALAAPRANYTTFVHLTRDPSQPPVAVGDSPPLGGSFPTSDWRLGEVIADSYSLTPPAASPSGSYLITVGLYDPATGQRLPATMPPSGPLPADAAIVGRVVLP
ncbi:MAG TPA: hypothetical protein VFZ25_06240, partial [Chloroflexota bacterium]|nr:hypothetical protein [Chloroflexota bacterium]